MMDLIYSFAFLTIVAAAGSDADAGLPGVLPNSRKAFQVSASINEIPIVTTSRCPLSHLKLSKWSSRGWTLQEQALSRRILVFTMGIVFIRCSKALFREDVVLEHKFGVYEQKKQTAGIILGIHDHLKEMRLWNADMWEELRSSGLMSAIDAWDIYRTLTGDLATREFTVQEDVLNAFYGISKTLEPSLGEFWYSLPCHRFIDSLLWTTDSEIPAPRRNGFPSWSWAGWRLGRTEKLYLRNPLLQPILVEDYYRFNHAQEIVRVIDGKAVKEPNIHELPSLSNITMKGRLLIMWGSVLDLSVDKDVDPKSKTPNTYVVRDSKRRIIGRITLNPEWRRKQPRRLPFVEVGRCKKRGIVMATLLGWDENEARRVACRLHTILPLLKETYWDAENPQRRLLVLG